jgi:hypothetical protein
VTADAPITKRCDGKKVLLKKDNKHLTHSEIVIVSFPQHSDAQVFKRHISSPARNKTQNITTTHNSRDGRYVSSLYMRSNQTAGFRAFPSRLLCRDRISYETEYGNLLLAVS